ncbi:MAG: YihY/virulence factor BrkB family protein [Acidobacteria bacterium]|nr:YihY/virulence factor BrkB family protein [Acidobacteriota bacterium]
MSRETTNTTRQPPIPEELIGSNELVDRHLSIQTLARRVWNEINTDNVPGLAAQMSYYFMLALFPFLIFLAAVVGTLPYTGLWDKILQWIINYLPQSSQKFVFESVLGLTRGRSEFLSLGILGTVWAASVGLLNLMGALNIAYEVEETRGIFKRAATVFSMLFVIAFSFLGSFALLGTGDWLNQWLVTWLGFDAVLLGLWHVGRWLVSLLLLAIGLSAVDYMLTNVKRPWRWITPGTAFAIVAWIPATVGFDLYARYIASYDKTYGALATAVVLMVWVYIIAVLTLVGAEINSELWKMRAEAESARVRKPPGGSEETFPERRLRAYGT